MSKKLAVKRLTASDLTFFVWHFRNNPAGNQKAINLNADVFVGQLYPALPDTDGARAGRIALDLSIYGPGAEGELNLQRKIIKKPSYKNWRLNGEFVDDPDNSDRFSPLVNGDLVVFEFIGEVSPEAAKAIFIARGLPQDQALHLELEKALGSNKMISIHPDELRGLIQRANTADTHPINELILDEALEDVALGGSEGAERLLRRRSGRKLTKDQLTRARNRVEEVGQQGEAFVNRYLIDLQGSGSIESFEWVSEENAIAPYDFHLRYSDSQILVDAKSTGGAFERSLHVSLNELREMAEGSRRYDLYRVFNMTDSEAHLRICVDMREFAVRILQVFDALPVGILVDAVSVEPASLRFGDPILITLEEDDDEPPQL